MPAISELEVTVIICYSLTYRECSHTKWMRVVRVSSVGTIVQDFLYTSGGRKLFQYLPDMVEYYEN